MGYVWHREYLEPFQKLEFLGGGPASEALNLAKLYLDWWYRSGVGGLEWGGSAGGGFLRSPPLLRPLQILPPVALIICAPPCVPLNQPRFTWTSAVLPLGPRALSLADSRPVWGWTLGWSHLSSPTSPATQPRKRRKWRRLSGTRSPVRAGTSTNRGRRQQVGKRWDFVNIDSITAAL